MPIIYGEQPVESFFVRTKNLPTLEKSGLFRLQIATAKYGWKTTMGEICPDDFDYTKPENQALIQCQWVRLGCAVKDEHGANAMRCEFSFFLPSAHAQDLAYFCNLRTADNRLYFPDASVVEHNFQGNPYRGYEFPALVGKEVCALLKYEGKRQRGNTIDSQFELVGFCDENGCGAFEVSNPAAYGGKPRPEYQKFLADVPAMNNVQMQPSPYGAAAAAAPAAAPALQAAAAVNARIAQMQTAAPAAPAGYVAQQMQASGVPQGASVPAQMAPGAAQMGQGLPLGDDGKPIF